MESPISVVAGATGLVGSYIVRNLSDLGGTQLILARSYDNELPKNAKLQIIDFDDLLLNKIKLNSKVDNVYLCLGKKLATHELLYMQDSSKESFKIIDFEYSLSIAKIAFEAGAKNIAVVSAIGAKEGSNNYYFHIKGKLEEEIKKIGYKNIVIAQPGHLLGKRNEFRGYEIPVLEFGLGVIHPLMRGPLKNFRQIDAKKVADAMVTKNHIRYFDSKSILYLTYDDFR